MNHRIIFILLPPERVAHPSVLRRVVLDPRGRGAEGVRRRASRPLGQVELGSRHGDGAGAGSDASPSRKLQGPSRDAPVVLHGGEQVFWNSFKKSAPSRQRQRPMRRNSLAAWNVPPTGKQDRERGSPIESFSTPDIPASRQQFGGSSDRPLHRIAFIPHPALLSDIHQFSNRTRRIFSPFGFVIFFWILASSKPSPRPRNTL